MKVLCTFSFGLVLTSLAYLGPCQTSMMELFVKIVNYFQLLTVLLKSYIIDV